jgi:Tat protein translocase TatC
VLALLLGAPWVLYQLWLFVGAGLYMHERKWVRLFLPMSLALFIAGAVFGYFVLIPFGLYFLAGFNVQHVSTMITLGDYFSLFLTLTVALGAIFQLPLAMIAVTLLGFVKPRTFAEKRRYFILAAFVFGAVLTPPDPVTQLLMAGPILVLYEIGLWGARAIERATAREAPAPGADG